MEKNNVFEGAYFGKPYRTRDGEKAIYLREDFKHHLYLENGGIIDCNRDGTFESVIGRIEKLDIVSEWQEELTDDELAKLAEEEYPYEDGIEEAYWNASQHKRREAFKAGYRKAMENK